MSFIKTAVLIFGLAASQLSLAALYKWVDEDGVTRYTTTPPPESAKFDREVIGKDGRKLDVIRGNMTAAEKAEEERRLAAEEKAKKDKAEAEKRDRILMMSFTSVDDLVIKRDQKLKQYREQISTQEDELEHADSKLESLVSKAIESERAGSAPSGGLSKRLNRAERQQQDISQQLRISRQDLFEAEKSYSADIERFKELKGIK